MSKDQLNPELLTVCGLFDHDTVYTVPIYQRNYAWRIEQIEQLVSDIQDAVVRSESGYFLGNLVVTQRASRNDFEVIDGQQRLTTLYLLLTFLENEGETPYTHHKGRLQYESRARATEALRRVGQESYLRAGQVQDSVINEDGGIHEGFNIIHQIIEQHERLRHKDDRRKFTDFLRAKVTVVRASLPPKTDLNRYFEIMNTRGQQLQQVDIVKARLMSKLPDSERTGFAWIWDACADMDSYVQMSLTRGDTTLRSKIFGSDWSWLAPTDFTALLGVCPQADANTSTASLALSLDAALQKYAHADKQESSADEGNERFRSTIEFPVFLLHVLKIKNGREDEDEGQLDDKRLIKSFTDTMPEGQEAQWVRDFAFTLLKCRNLFDGFILKRQFTTRVEEDEGDWSLQRLKKNVSNGKSTPGYAHVFRQSEAVEESDPDSDTRNVLLLQSMLRITYTAPRTMHWLTRTLQWLATHQRPEAVASSGLAHLLKGYARAKVASAFFDAEVQPQEFGIARIVFTYLDYLLLNEKPNRNFKFQFRNSIEHFYPQHPDKEQSGAPVSGDKRDLLGNLALVSVSANSKFSNSLPKAKAENFKDTIEIQSPKLQRMAEITRSEGWDDEQVTKHHAQMVALLKADIQK